jgi:hypothetical protein
MQHVLPASTRGRDQGLEAPGLAIPAQRILRTSQAQAGLLIVVVGQMNASAFIA